VLQFYFDKLINVGDPQEYFRKNQQVGRSEQTITISPNELYRLVTFVSSKLDEVVHTSLPPPHMSCIASRHTAVRLTCTDLCVQHKRLRTRKRTEI
jgi:hypothetical protein